jgi:acetylornithine/succinyldiaminopimelate/putrescine aminotransferase
MVCASWDFQVIILMPPLNITIAEMQEGLNRIEATLQQVSGAGQTIQSCSPAQVLS